MGHAPRALAARLGRPRRDRSPGDARRVGPLLALALAALPLAGCASAAAERQAQGADEAAPAQAPREGPTAEAGAAPERPRAPEATDAAGPPPAPEPFANDPWTERPRVPGTPPARARPARVDLGAVGALDRRQWPVVPPRPRVGVAWVVGGELVDDAAGLLDLEARLAREEAVAAVLALAPPVDLPEGAVARTPDLCAWAREQGLDLLLALSHDPAPGGAAVDRVLVLHVAAAAPLEVWRDPPPSGRGPDDLVARLAAAGLAALTR